MKLLTILLICLCLMGCQAKAPEMFGTISDEETSDFFKTNNYVFKGVKSDGVKSDLVVWNPSDHSGVIVRSYVTGNVLTRYPIRKHTTIIEGEQ